MLKYSYIYSLKASTVTLLLLELSPAIVLAATFTT